MQYIMTRKNAKYRQKDIFLVIITTICIYILDNDDIITP